MDKLIKVELLSTESRESMGFYYFHVAPMSGDTITIGDSNKNFYKVILRAHGFGKATNESMEEQIKEKYRGAFAIVVEKVENDNT